MIARVRQILKAGWWGGVVLLVSATMAQAEVTRVEITQRFDLGDSGYERIEGTLYFAVDPRDPRNRVIADLDLAPTNAAGRVEFSADLCILRTKGPVTPNNVALVDVVNRGRKGVYGSLSRGAKGDPKTAADLGDAFLLRHGFTVVWVGWEFDVPEEPGLMRIKVPPAKAATGPISGFVRGDFTVNARTDSFTLTELAAYAPADPAHARSRLTWRVSERDATAQEIPRARWHATGRTVTLEGGFEPGRRYEFGYESIDPPVAGLGLLAFRDTAAWLRSEANPLVRASYTYAFGSSQSGRFLRELIYDGLYTDETGNPVFDGVMAHIAGSARIDLNQRWAVPRRLGAYGATAFPFHDQSTVDGVSAVRDGLLAKSRLGRVPRIFYTNTAVEYWGGGRVAALTHTSPAGDADLVPVDEQARIYFFAGTQHSPAQFPPAKPALGQQLANPVDYWWSMRALLLAMDRWVRQGVTPPENAYPNLEEHNLVPAARVGFPAIPGVQSPRPLTAGFRIANPFHANGAGGGTPLPLLVPQVDADGNELAGIRLPEVAVPLGTYTGWNFRQPAVGAPEDLVPLLGSWIPFPATGAAANAVKDPRRSIADRYASREEYLNQIDRAAAVLVQQRLLLAEDVPAIRQRTAEQWDWIAAGARAP